MYCAIFTMLQEEREEWRDIEKNHETRMDAKRKTWVLNWGWGLNSQKLEK